MAGKTRITSASKKTGTPKEKKKMLSYKEKLGLGYPDNPDNTNELYQEINGNIETGYQRETSHVLPIGLQFFAKKSSDYKTTQLTPKEYAHGMSEIATWATEQQLNQNVFQKCIGNYIYTVENNGFGNFRIINRRKIK